MTFHDFITSSDEFYWYIGFQFAMCLTAFAIGWLSAWIWLLKKVDRELERNTKDEDWSM